MSVNLSQQMAKIAIKKSLLKEFKSSDSSRVVFMNDGDEFQIELFNSKNYRIGAKIYLNGEPLSDILVIRPGERVWLERYFNKSRKFKFSTYEVEDNNKEVDFAIKNNGEVKIEFYKEIVVSPTIIYNPVFTTYNYSNIDPISISISGDILCNTAFSTNSLAKTTIENKETGRIDMGSKSNQIFNNIDINFETYPFNTEIIKILPMSRKPYTSSDLKKKYCPNCGRKITDKYKYCPFCGEKLN